MKNYTRVVKIAFEICYNNLTKYNPKQSFGVFRRTLNHAAHRHALRLGDMIK